MRRPCSAALGGVNQAPAGQRAAPGQARQLGDQLGQGRVRAGNGQLSGYSQGKRQPGAQCRQGLRGCRVIVGPAADQGPGQTPGLSSGQLPPGFLPLTHALRAQARKAAQEILNQSGVTTS
jgi:hypothetical protein